MARLYLPEGSASLGHPQTLYPCEGSYPFTQDHTLGLSDGPQERFSRFK